MTILDLCLMCVITNNALVLSEVFGMLMFVRKVPSC